MFNVASSAWNYNGVIFPLIKWIRHNPAKNSTAVAFYDGTVIVVRRNENDADNLYFAVASAIAERLYGSNSGFKREIDKHTITIKKTAMSSIGKMADGVTEIAEFMRERAEEGK